MNTSNQQPQKTSQPPADTPVRKPEVTEPPRPDIAGDQVETERSDRDAEDRQDDRSRVEGDVRMREQNDQRQSSQPIHSNPVQHARSYPEAFGVATGEAIHLYWAASERTTMRFYRAIGAYIEAFHRDFAADIEDAEEIAKAYQSRSPDSRSFIDPARQASGENRRFGQPQGSRAR